MKRKLFWILIVLLAFIIIIVLVGVMVFIYSGDKTSNTELSFENIELTDTSFTAQCIFTSSGKSFRKYDYTMEGDTLYLTVYGGLVNRKYPNGDFEIVIEDHLENITKVCLNGTDEVTVLYKRQFWFILSEIYQVSVLRDFDVKTE